MRTWIKVCCIANEAEASLAIDAGADALGFVAARPSSPRTIPDALIAQIIASVPSAVSTVLLTTEVTAAGIAAQVRSCRASSVQVLNHISDDESARLAHEIPDIKRVQVVHVTGIDALDMIGRYSNNVGAFLLDSGSPDAAMPQHGGTGIRHDWSISAEFVRRSQRPTYLAGGITAENAADAIRQVQPQGLDLCSGVRTNGRLDAEKLSRFIAAVREADSLFIPSREVQPPEW